MLRSTRSITTLLTASVLAFAFAAPAGAEVYKWTDARGVVHYTNVRPPANQAAKRVAENQLSVIALPKPSAEEVRALNERLLNRRIDQLEQALRERRGAPSMAYAPPPAYDTYYPGGGYFYPPEQAPLGEIVIDRETPDASAPGSNRRTNIQFIPRYEVRPGPYGVGAQAVPVQPRARPRLEARRP